MAPTLAALENTFLWTTPAGVTPAAPPIFSGNTEVFPCVDGKDYFAEISAAIDSCTGKGDVIYIVSWWIDIGLELVAGAAPLGTRLVEKAAAGVDVRVILFAHRGLQGTGSGWYDVFTNAQYATLRGTASLGMSGFVGVVQANAAAARRLRAATPASGGAAPLKDRVLLNWSGHHGDHTKSTVIQGGGTAVAFVGGIDYQPNRVDEPGHVARAPGWHDIGVRIRGAGVAGVWSDFETRWRETGTLSPRHMTVGGSRELFNPDVTADPVAPVPALSPAGAQSVQIVRTFGRVKELNLFGEGTNVDWATLPAKGLREIRNVLSKAIDGSLRYVYVEDQGFGGATAATKSLYPRLIDAANRGVKVLFVTSGTADPTDPQRGPVNRVVDPVVKRDLIDAIDEHSRVNFALYRVDELTVHSKMVLIDDRFLSIGSANFWDTSMHGDTSELNVVGVDALTLVEQLRVKVWADHMRVPLADAAVAAEIADLTKSLGFWRPTWGVGLTAAKPADKLKRVWPP